MDRNYASVVSGSDASSSPAVFTSVPNKLTVSAALPSKDLTHDDIWAALETAKLLAGVRGLQISYNKRFFEIRFRDRSSLSQALEKPFILGGRLIQFRHTDEIMLPVTLLNIPLGVKNDEIFEQLDKYGEIDCIEWRRRQYKKLTYADGARIVLFSRLNYHIPRSLTMYGRTIKVFYNSQPNETTKPTKQTTETESTKEKPQQPENDSRTDQEQQKEAEPTSEQKNKSDDEPEATTNTDEHIEPSENEQEPDAEPDQSKESSDDEIPNTTAPNPVQEFTHPTDTTDRNRTENVEMIDETLIRDPEYLRILQHFRQYEWWQGLTRHEKHRKILSEKTPRYSDWDT